MNPAAGKARMARSTSTRMALAVLVLSSIVPVAAAETGAAVLVYHPYPDDADPLGFPFDKGLDAFSVRHGHRFDGAPPYPVIVVDGTYVIAGIPDAADPQESTDAALIDAFDARRGVEAPVAMTLASMPGDPVRVAVDLAPASGLTEGHLWLALAEDHVFFEPPTALSNGVTDHRFTVRAVEDLGVVPLTATLRLNASITWRDTWDEEQMWLVAWVQATAEATRFGAHEVLQAVAQRLGGPPAAQTSRAVLVETLSATWCDPCLHGDRAVERLAREAGLADDGPDAPSLTRWPTSAMAIAVAWSAAGMGALVAAWPRRSP